MAQKNDSKFIISAGFSGILILMSLLIYIALEHSNALSNNMSILIKETNAKIGAANSMRDAIRLRAHSLKAMALNEDFFVRDEEYIRFLGYSRIYRDGREKLLSMPLNANEKEILDNLDAATRIAQPLNDHAAELLQTPVSARETNAALNKASVQQEFILILLNELVNFEKVTTDLALQSAEDDYVKSRQIMFIIAGSVLILGLIIAAFVIRSTVRKNNHIYYQANHDALTGLFNRRAFAHKLDEVAKSAANTEAGSVLLYLDLDQFKIINDTCGHLAGDQVLCRVATLLTRKLRHGDFIARLGGDEFGVILVNSDMPGAIQVAETLRESVENFRLPWEGQEFSVGVSIGAVPIKSDSGDMATILSTADMACLEAKQSGRNRVRMADTDDVQIARHRADMDCLGRLKQALEDNRLTLYYQSVVSVGGHNKKPDHVEILVRMISTSGEIVPPGNFIPVAERFGQMTGIDKWVVKHAVEWLSERRHGYAPPKLMINLSGQSIGDETFLPYILDALNSKNILPGSICFEITETAAMANLDKALAFIKVLKSIGCEFALDDFGSGLSSFAYLKRLPVDFLKIDGVFVKEIVNDPIDYAMVNSINEIGHVMGKKTIAEFVEDEVILEMLETIGVDYAQGYGVALPKPLNELISDSSFENEKLVGKQVLNFKPYPVDAWLGVIPDKPK